MRRSVSTWRMATPGGAAADACRGGSKTPADNQANASSAALVMICVAGDIAPTSGEPNFPFFTHLEVRRHSMIPTLKQMIVPATVCCALLLPVTAFAQDHRPADDVFTKAAGNVTPSAVFRPAGAARVNGLAVTQQRPRRGGPGPVATGALNGAAVALVGTAVAAHSY